MAGFPINDTPIVINSPVPLFVPEFVAPGTPAASQKASARRHPRARAKMAKPPVPKVETTLQRPHAPIFAIEIGGKRTAFGTPFSARIGADSLDARVTELTYEDKEKLTAQATFTIVARLEDADAVMPSIGDKVRLQWGYVGNMSPTHHMTVTAVDPHYAADITIKVTCRDGTDALGRGVSHHIWRDTPLGKQVADLARQAGWDVQLPSVIQARYNGVLSTTVVQGGQILATDDKAQAEARGIRTTVASFGVRGGIEPKAPNEAKILNEVKTLSQQGRTAWGQLRWIANRTGCDIKGTPDGRSLVFKPHAHAAPPSWVFVYRSQDSILKNFSVKTGKGNKNQAPGASTKSAGVDPMTKKALDFTANDLTTQGRVTLGKNLPQVDGQAGTTGGVGATPGAAHATSARAEKRLEAAQRKVGGIAVRFVDSAKRAAVEAFPTVVDGLRAARNSALFGAILPIPSGDAKEAQDHAKAQFDEAERGGIHASADIIGFPQIQRGEIAEIRGVAKRDEGKYMISGVTAKIGKDGFDCHLDLKRHGTNDKKKGSSRPNESRPRDKAKAAVDVINLNGRGGYVGTIYK